MLRYLWLYAAHHNTVDVVVAEEGVGDMADAITVAHQDVGRPLVPIRRKIPRQGQMNRKYSPMHLRTGPRVKALLLRHPPGQPRMLP